MTVGSWKKYMNWANTMAVNANDASNDRPPSDDRAQRSAAPGSWDPHQVWLTRVKQPRDDRRPPVAASGVKLSPRPTGVHFWSRATR